MTNLETQIQALVAATHAYARENDNRRTVAIATDLVNAILATRVPNSPATDRVLSQLIRNYIIQIESHWS